MHDTMTVYHGSAHNFQNLKVTPAMAGESAKRNEGPGIYFSKQKSVAESYGKYIYTIRLDKNIIMDFRKYSTCLKYLKSICETVRKSAGVKISEYVNINKTAEYLHEGNVAISATGWELWLLLDATEDFHRHIGCTKQLAIYKALKKWDRENPKIYLYTDSIKDVGVIRRHGLGHAEIISKEKQREKP